MLKKYNILNDNINSKLKRKIKFLFKMKGMIKVGKANRNISSDFDLMAILLIPVAIAINIVGGQLAALLKLPIYLDCIGTIIVGMLAGPWVGAATGFLSNAINAIFDPTFFPYSLVSIAVGLVTGFLSLKNMFKKLPNILISGVIISLTASVVAAPITAYLFGGVTGSGSTLITAMLLATGRNLIQSVFTSQIISDLADKLISIFVAYFIIRNMSARYLSKFKCGNNFIHK